MPDSSTTKRQKYQILTELNRYGVEVNTGLVNKMYLSDLRAFLRAVKEAERKDS